MTTPNISSGYVDEVDGTRDQLQKLLNNIKADAVEVLERAGIELHAVTARLKGKRSLISKLRTKSYDDPWTDVMDLLAIRVMTYYEDHVEDSVKAIQDRFGWQPDHSIDKRKNLGTREFGYRSVHIIAPTPPALTRLLACKTPKYFEVQIRSILEHVWAEIDHEVVYKSGIDFPEATKRRFGALAGSLEILDREFVHVRKVQQELVHKYRIEYTEGKGGNEVLDTARIIGALLCRAPSAHGWQRTGSALFDFQNARVYVEALADAGLTTWNALRNTLDTPRHRVAREAFAAAAGITADDVGHRALVALAIGITSSDTLDQFPELGSGDVRAAITAASSTSTPTETPKPDKVNQPPKNVVAKANSAKKDSAKAAKKAPAEKLPSPKKKPVSNARTKRPAKKAPPSRGVR